MGASTNYSIKFGKQIVNGLVLRIKNLMYLRTLGDGSKIISHYKPMI